MNAQRFGLCLTALLLAIGTSVRAQSILPADGQEPPSGANPFQGLGREDDPGPNRVDPPPQTAAASEGDTPAAGDKGADTGSDGKVQSAQELAEEDEKKREEEERNREERRKAEREAEKEKDALGHGHHGHSNDPLKVAIQQLHIRQYDKCLELVDKVLQMNPNNPQAHYVRGVAYVMTRQYSKAAAEYREVLKLAPTGKIAQLASEGLRKINF
jgi:tetratricopeptide (TPR) repeat protein